MVSNNSTEVFISDELNVRATIREVLDNHIVTDIHTNPDAQIVAVEFGSQYRWQTAQRVVRDEVTPTIPDNWTVTGFISTGVDIETYQPLRILSLSIIPLKEQQVSSSDIPRGVMGVVTGGLDEYLNERKFVRYDIPSTYSEWYDEWNDDAPIDSRIIEGPIGVARNVDEKYWRGWDIDYVKSAVRILNGKGRYDSDEYQFHTGVPFAVVSYSDGAVIIAPRFDKNLDDVYDPDFTYNVTDREYEIGKNIEFL